MVFADSQRHALIGRDLRSTTPGFGGTGLVEVKGGELRTPTTGFFSFDYAYVLGEMAGSSGTVIVEDRNSRDGVWSTAFDILAGDLGAGHMDVKAGGQIQARSLYVGEEAESIANTITVAGLHSKLELSAIDMISFTCLTLKTAIQMAIRMPATCLALRVTHANSCGGDSSLRFACSIDDRCCADPDRSIACAASSSRLGYHKGNPKQCPGHRLIGE